MLLKQKDMFRTSYRLDQQLSHKEHITHKFATFGSATRLLLVKAWGAQQLADGATQRGFAFLPLQPVSSVS